jgi:hypothetical protein
MIPNIERNDLILLLATALMLILNRFSRFIKTLPLPLPVMEGRNYLGDSFY